MDIPIIVVHGGAGSIAPENYPRAREGILQALDAGWEVLSRGGSAVDAVQKAVEAMEDYPYFNAGRGSVLTDEGTLEMDAMIVDGARRKVGGVIAVSRVKHPVALSRLVMDRSFHVLFAGEGAEKFASEQGMELIDPDTLVTDRVRRRLEKFLEDQKSYGDYIAPSSDPERRDKYGTVGAVAIDVNGELAAATSTGGVLGKKVGRVGDTPIFGAGTFADDQVAVSGTGIGEFIIKSYLGLEIRAQYLVHGDARTASLKALEKMKGDINGSAGVIVVTKDGQWAAEKNTRDLAYGVRTPTLQRDFTED